MDSTSVSVELKNQILSKIDPEAVINIIDETHKHLKHNGYMPGKYHFILNINSKKLNNMKKIDSHKEIYRAASSLMPYIHALTIKIALKKEIINV